MFMPDYRMIRLLATPDGFAELRSAGGGLSRRFTGWVRYRRALRELRRLDDRDLDDLAIGRADLPQLARRHAAAHAPA